MSKIKLSISVFYFLAINIISCLPAFADSYAATIQKINIREDRLFADNTNKISSKKNILELADAIGNTIDNPKLLPKISFPLGSISLKTLNQSLKAKGIKAAYSKSSCLSMRSQNEFLIILETREILDSKSTLPILVANRSFLTQGKPSSSDTGQTNKCPYSIVNPARLRQGDRNLQLKLYKQGYMSIELGFKVVLIDKMQPVLKFDNANSTLEDERSFRSFKFLIDGGSPELQEQIAQQITKNHPRLDRLITSKSVSEILNLKNPRITQQRPINNSNGGGGGSISSYPDYIIKLDVSQ